MTDYLWSLLMRAKLPEAAAQVNHQRLFLGYPGKRMKLQELRDDLTVIIDEVGRS